MSSLPKYVVHVKFEASGLVEKPDVIGAIFGQTEGLFGSEMDLHELQKGGRIGRIEIELETKEGKTFGTIMVPSSLDRASTALLAAAIESIDRIGPYPCKMTLDKLVDTREEKRKAIVSRAKEILREWTIKTASETGDILREVKEEAEAPKPIAYGSERLPAGPGIDEAGSIIVVEGRADVVHLLKYGYENVIALEGAKIPETIIKLSKEKEVTAFLDGNRSADLIQKNLLQMATIDFVARAPPGREVEELSAKEIVEALRKRIPTKELREEGVRRRRRPIEPVVVPKQVKDATLELKGTLEAILFDENMERICRIPVSELVEKLSQLEKAHTIVFDGIITRRLVDLASAKGVNCLIADRISSMVKYSPIQLLTFSDIVAEDDG